MMSDDKEQKQSPFPLSIFKDMQLALREELSRIVYSIPSDVRADVLLALSSPGKLFDPTEEQVALTSLPSGLWPLLVVYCGLSSNPQASQTHLQRIAVAVECFICALDILDDVEDGDQTYLLKRLGNARALNVSTMLLALAQRTILDLEETSPLLLRKLSLSLHDALWHATEGQHRDLLAEEKDLLAFTQDDCIDIASLKAGSLMRFACSAGVLYACGEGEIYEKFAKIGHLLGIAAQLDNDSHDLYYLLHREDEEDHANDKQTTHSRIIKSDFERHKKTLPLVLFGQSEQYRSLSSNEARAQKELFTESIFAAWGISLLYHERVRECLHDIENVCTISPELRVLLRVHDAS